MLAALSGLIKHKSFVSREFCRVAPVVLSAGLTLIKKGLHLHIALIRIIKDYHNGVLQVLTEAFTSNWPGIYRFNNTHYLCLKSVSIPSSLRTHKEAMISRFDRISPRDSLVRILLLSFYQPLSH